MFLSQVMWESDGLRAKAEYACKDTGCPGVYEGGSNGKNYFGRGYIQLTHIYNYKECSADLFGDDRLVQNPDKVATDEDLAWGTAAWFWKKKVHQQALSGNFGATTKVINGALECSGANTDKAKKRFEIYKKVCAAFGVTDTPVESGCYN